MNLVSLLITLLILVAIMGIIWYVIGMIPLPEPMRIVVIILFAVIAIVILLSLIPGVGGIVHIPMGK